MLAFLTLANVVPLTAWCFLGNALGNWHLRRSSRAWLEIGPPLEGFGARLAVHPTNEAARRLEEAAARTGIDLVAADEWPEDERPTLASDVSRELRTHLQRVLEREDSVIEAAPDAVQKLMASCRVPVGEIQELLLAGEAPRWHQDAREALDAKLPNFKGHLELCRLMVALALEETRLGRHGEAERLLTAAWRWWEVAHQRPELLSHLIAMAEAKELIGALRKVPAPSATWIDRLDSFDPVGRLSQAYRFEAWCWDAIARGEAAPGRELEYGVLRLIHNPLGRPYLKLSVAWYEREMLAQVRGYRAQDPCSYAEIPTPEYTKGNMGGIARLKAGGPFLRARELEVARALTMQVLAVKELRRRSPAGRYPARPPDVGQPPCPSSRWIYEVGPDGAMSLTLDPEPDWPDATKGFDLPTRYVEAARGET